MGLFDTVKIKCPKCNEDVEEQTKLGSCMLEYFDFDTAPVHMKYTMLGRHTCYNCKSEFEVKEIIKPTFGIRLLTQDEIDKEGYRK